MASLCKTEESSKLGKQQLPTPAALPFGMLCSAVLTALWPSSLSALA